MDGHHPWRNWAGIYAPSKIEKQLVDLGGRAPQANPSQSKPHSNMNYTTNNFEMYRHAAEINDQWDNYSSIIAFQSKSMTLMELMETMNEIFERFPFAKDYKIISLGNAFNTTCVEIDKERGCITIK